MLKNIEQIFIYKKKTSEKIIRHLSIADYQRSIAADSAGIEWKNEKPPRPNSLAVAQKQNPLRSLEALTRIRAYRTKSESIWNSSNLAIGVFPKPTMTVFYDKTKAELKRIFSLQSQYTRISRKFWGITRGERENHSPQFQDNKNRYEEILIL